VHSQIPRSQTEHSDCEGLRRIRGLLLHAGELGYLLVDQLLLLLLPLLLQPLPIGVGANLGVVKDT